MVRGGIGTPGAGGPPVNGAVSHGFRIAAVHQLCYDSSTV